MAVNITNSFGYFWLDSWVLANIIELGTQSFCDRFVTYEIDPEGRLYDQMVLAARSVPANVAEGSARHDTSTETEMRLTDVGRGSLGELMGDYLNFLLYHCSGMSRMSRKAIKSTISEMSTSSTNSTLSTISNKIWSVNSPEYRSLMYLRLDPPQYSNDLLHDVGDHILAQKAKFDPWIENEDPVIAANALMYLCLRVINIVKRQLEAQLEKFKQEGGFREQMTESRLQAKQEQNALQGAPTCLHCGATMVMKMCKAGARSGKRFWSCPNYRKTGCNYTINID